MADGVSGARGRKRRTSDDQLPAEARSRCEWLGDVTELGPGADDESIATYAKETDRLVLTQDDDFFTELDIDQTAGVLFQKDQTLSAREVGDIVHELSRYVEQSEITLEYVSRNWL